jgi:hypothetical protein
VDLHALEQDWRSTSTSVPVFAAEGEYRDSVSHVSSYNVTVGNATVRVKTLQEVQAVVMEHVTSLLAQDPEAAAEGAMMAKRAFSVGTVQHALDANGSWRTNVTVCGEPVLVVVVKRRLWRW